MKYKGVDLEKLAQTPPLFDSTFEFNTKVIVKKSDRMFVEACMKVNVDPDVVIKQAKLIQELQAIIVELLQKEKEELNAQLKEIKEIVYNDKL